MVRCQSTPELTISGLAKAGGVGVETVRYYQRRGLLQQPERPQTGGLAGGARRYAHTDVERLKFIKAAQAGGFTLDEIGELLALDATADRARVRGLARARVAALDAKIAEMQVMRDALSRLADTCEASEAGPCPILGAFRA